MSALAGIDIALWDLKARKLNVPVYQLLGGKVRSQLKVYAWIGGDRPSDVQEQAYVYLYPPLIPPFLKPTSNNPPAKRAKTKASPPSK